MPVGVPVWESRCSVPYMDDQHETHCPHCETDLRGKPIPEDLRHLYGDATHYSLAATVEIPGVYDGGLFYQCPACGGRWHRWPEGHRLRTKAEPYVSGGAEL